MYQTLKNQIGRDTDYPLRQFDIACRTLARTGHLYDHLLYDFNQEKQDSTGAYIPLRNRRPSVQYGLCKVIVNDSVSMLFSEAHFPAVVCEDEATDEALEALIKDSKLNAVMLKAATIGSVGSVAIVIRVLNNRIFFDAKNTQFLTPIWKPEAPDVLLKIVERYKVKGIALQELGYDIADDDLSVNFWFRREFTEQSEDWYVPVKVEGKNEPTALDTDRTVKHNLGFVPVIWVKNLPTEGDDIDGEATFSDAVINDSIEIDYQLSQQGRGLKYNADPTLVIKEPPFGDGDALTKGGANAIVLDKDGDAKLLEINGTSTDAVLQYVRAVRELALESCGGNRANADKLSAAQSGRAMELMNQTLIWLADKLRISYGEGALIDLLNMIVKISQKIQLLDKKGRKIGVMSADVDITLRWPRWYQPTYADLQTQAMTLGMLRDKQLMSQQTAVNSLADAYDIENVEEELKTIEPLLDGNQDLPAKQEKLSESDD